MLGGGNAQVKELRACKKDSRPAAGRPGGLGMGNFLAQLEFPNLEQAEAMNVTFGLSAANERS